MTSKIQSKSEQNTKIIRQIGQLSHNKNCFDCGQKGPTYLNDTIGAFVCTGCSGILRGLNPPHRIKSISMGTFSDDEVKFVQQRGNAFCRKVWLWNYDPQIGPRPPEVRDDQKMKDFLSLKYEKKKWFHAGHETQFADQLKQEDQGSVGSLKGPDSDHLPRRTSSTNSQQGFHSFSSATGGSTNGTAHATPGATGNISLPRSHTSSSVNHTTPEPSSNLPSDDLFNVFGALSVASAPSVPTAPFNHMTAHSQPGPFPAVPSNHSNQQEWASFARSHTTPQFPPAHHAPPVPQAQPNPVHHPFSQPIPFTSAPQQKNTATVPLQPTTTAGKPQATPVATSKPAVPSNSDKYAALAELDEAFNSSAPAVTKTVLPDPRAYLANSPPAGGYHRSPPQAVPWGAAPAPSYGQPAGGGQGNGFWTESLNQPAMQHVPVVDSSNVWAQLGTFDNGPVVANPFMGGPPATTAPYAAGGPRVPPGSYNTNPFL